MHSDQTHLERVHQRISRAVIEFCYLGREFHIEDLNRHVQSRTGIAPGSEGRIFRRLRRSGLLNYIVVRRRASKYRIVPLRQPVQPIVQSQQMETEFGGNFLFADFLVEHRDE